MDNERHTLEAPNDFTTINQSAKTAAIEALCGIRSLTDLQLLSRLEEVFFVGVKVAADHLGADPIAVADFGQEEHF